MEWFWDNSSNINAIINIITTVVSGTIFVVGLAISILRLKLKSNQYNYLNLVIDSQTKQSMKYYISTRAQDIDPCDEDNNDFSCIKLIPFFIKQIFKGSDEQYFIILADSGMGKTTFLLRLFFRYYKKILRKYDIVFIPLALNSAIEKIREIKNQSNTILLLDGFDEDQYAMRDYVSRLNDICNATELFYKVIMTCRTQFFPDSDSEPKYTHKIKFGVGKKIVEFKKYYLSPFNNQEIDIFLKKKYNCIFERNKIKRSKSLIENCPQLMVRPMLLSYLDDLLIDNKKRFDYAYEIYGELVAKWIEREAVENKLLFEFSEKVAEHMYLKKTVYIDKNEIEELCRTYNIQIRNIEAKSRSLLNRNANGNYKFAHKSILEYFLAKKAFDEIKFRKTIMITGFKGYDMLEHFIGEMSDRYIKLEFNKEFFDFSYLQLPNIKLSETKILYGNFERSNLCDSVFLFADLNESNFLGANLKNVNLGGANLRKADLREANLIGANLSHTDLSEANLSGLMLIQTNLNEAKLIRTNLSNANLMCVDFSGMNLEGANLEGANLINAFLQGVNLYGANLKKSNLRNADLRNADLEGADLEGADLEGINLKKNDMRKILQKLKETKFTYIILEEKGKQKKVYRSKLFPNRK